jgi:hypothetical protein
VEADPISLEQQSQEQAVDEVNEVEDGNSKSEQARRGEKRP